VQARKAQQITSFSLATASEQVTGAVIFEHACKLGLEGIVCKRIDLPYRAGPSKSWIKVKNKKHPAMLRVKEAFELERQRGHARAL